MVIYDNSCRLHLYCLNREPVGGHAAFEGFYRLWTHYDASDLKNSSNLDSTLEDVHMSNFYPKVDKILSPLHSSQENKELEADTTSTPKKNISEDSRPPDISSVKPISYRH